MVFREQLGLIRTVWATAFREIRRHPVIVAPFLIISLCEALALTILYLAPRPPLVSLFGPPIRVLFKFPGYRSGEPYLHYPTNFLLLPRLFFYSQILIGATVGLIMTAVVIRMILQIDEEDRINWGKGLKTAFIRFPTLLTLWLIIFLLQWVAGTQLSRLGKSPAAFQMLYYAGIVLTVLVEAFFIYAIPAVIIEAQRAWRAITRTFSLACRMFFPTLAITVIPLLLRVAMALLERQQVKLIEDLSFPPEITLYILGLSIFVAFAAETFLRISAVILFLLKRETERQAVSNE